MSIYLSIQVNYAQENHDEYRKMYKKSQRRSYIGSAMGALPLFAISKQLMAGFLAGVKTDENIAAYFFDLRYELH
ncbi:hypothetical protein CHISP_0808 [Chitinispirillum alkaliphilum]|nr:hypothetical protein CHISP_0808 [Chitinispirillum alkaliphilum]